MTLNRVKLATDSSRGRPGGSTEEWRALSADAPRPAAGRRRVTFAFVLGAVLLLLAIATGIVLPLKSLDPLDRALAPSSAGEAR